MLPIGSTRAASMMGLKGYEISVPDSAIHRYKLDEGSGTTATDSIGSLDATLNTDNVWTSGTWVGDNAVSMDGTDDNGDIGNVSAVEGETEVWIAATINVTDASLSSGQNAFYQGDSSSGTDNIGINVFEGNVRFLVDADSTIYLGTSISSNTTYRVLGRYDGSNQEIWINGTKANSTSQSGGVNSTTAPLSIGSRAGEDSYYEGIIDDCVIGVGTISDQEIQDDYDRQPWS